MDFPGQQIGGFTKEELSWSEWYIKHQAKLRQILVWALVIFNVLIWGYVAYGAVKYFLLDWQRSEQQLAQQTVNLIDYRFFDDKNRPQDLNLSSVQPFDLGNGRFDYLVQAENPNAQWEAKLDYYFDYSGRADASDTATTQNVKHTFVLPGDQKYLFDFSIAGGAGSKASLVVKNVAWQRVINFESIRQEKLNFSFTKPEYTTPVKVSSGSPLAVTNFTVSNKSAYNFWRVGFYILLYRGNQLMAADYVVQDDFNSGSSRIIQINWYQRLTTPSKIEVIPDVDILNPLTFKPAEAGSGEVK
ncbi:MAG: hypothetical protein NTY61_01700 [Candidatus Parcubacteria bacterium]|nr:hypothetical protein [Candidatus Parcubacteria bacterium]